MALTHYAYSFNSELFHSKLASRIIRDHKINLDALYRLALESVSTLEYSVRKVLAYLRYDEDWLVNSDDDVSRSHKWYLLCLMKYLSPVPSLSYSLPNSYSVLSKILPLVEWSNEDVKLMIEGSPLSSLVSSSYNALFISEFTSGIDQYGGWLNSNKVFFLLEKLDNTMQKLQVKANLELEVPPEKIMMACNDAYQMLQLTCEREHSLFLVLD